MSHLVTPAHRYIFASTQSHMVTHKLTHIETAYIHTVTEAHTPLTLIRVYITTHTHTHWPQACVHSAHCSTHLTTYIHAQSDTCAIITTSILTLPAHRP